MPLLVLDFGLDIVDGVRRLHLKGDGIPYQGLQVNFETKPSVSSFSGRFSVDFNLSWMTKLWRRRKEGIIGGPRGQSRR